METETIREVLDRLADLPAEIAGWEIEIGEDASGSEAIWVWVTLVEDEVPFSARQTIRERVRQAIREETGSPKPWVYVRFQSKSELPGS